MNAKRRAALHVLARSMKGIKAELDECAKELSVLWAEEQAAYDNTLEHLFNKREARYMALDNLRSAWGSIAGQGCAASGIESAIESIEDAAAMEL